MLEGQFEALLDRIVDARTPSEISAYETRIAKMERQKLLIAEKLANERQQGRKQAGTFEELFERAWEFLSSPCKIWGFNHLTLHRKVLRLAFTERLNYHRKTGFEPRIFPYHSIC